MASDLGLDRKRGRLGDLYGQGSHKGQKHRTPRSWITARRAFAALLLVGWGLYYRAKYGHHSRPILDALYSSHVDPDDVAPGVFNRPTSLGVDLVNTFIGSAGPDPNLSGGMIPSVAPPFAMTRWVAQTAEHFVSRTPYNYSHNSIHGFVGTHQPAIWMGESGHATVVPGLGEVTSLFEERGMSFDHAEEMANPSYYGVQLLRGEDEVWAEMSATSKVGHLRFTFNPKDLHEPRWILLQASRSYPLHGWKPGNLTYPKGSIYVDPTRLEISGLNRERQDDIIGPNKTPKFAGYFVARFDKPWEEHGIVIGCNTTSKIYTGETEQTESTCLSAYVKFSHKTKQVNVRVAVSFISIEKARESLDAEAPDGQTLEMTAYETRKLWARQLNKLRVKGGSLDDQTVLYSAAYHALQYPYEQDEGGQYYSAFTDSVHSGVSYTGFSIWDTFRAAWAWQILVAPDRVNDMVTSMLQNYKEGGWLPMWLNIAETNIMIGTHADSLIAEALLKGLRGFDVKLAYEAIKKDAAIAPEGDKTIDYADREEGVGYEVRAGLTSEYEKLGFVASDLHSESASRTLDYAYDDHAVSVAARLLGHDEDADYFSARSYRAVSSMFDNSTGFMRARNKNGTWAADTAGWTEGDKWAYSFDVVQNVPQLAELKGGNAALVHFLDEHFEGGHNDHTNEPSHHIPYLYAMLGAASRTQTLVREIASANYNNSEIGLSGNEDCGQMSAWYLFSSLGFYPVDPVSGDYIIGSPLFDRFELDLPDSKTLIVEANGASGREKPFVKSVHLNGRHVTKPIIKHEELRKGGHLVFEMSEEPQSWGNELLYTA